MSFMRDKICRISVIFRKGDNYEINHSLYWLWTSRCRYICRLPQNKTSHSYRNRSKLQKLFELIGKSIPTINDEIFYDDIEDYIKDTLIEPDEMLSICDELLNSEFDLLGMKDRIVFILQKKKRKIVEYSNVIQFDGMGYPLRLVIDSKGKQLWIDTTERDGDIVLKWEKISKLQ